MSASEPTSAVAATARRRWPVRLILVGVVFALVLPGLLFCGLLLGRISHGERVRNVDAAQSTALRTAETLDREISNYTSALIALATSPALDQADLPTFAQQVRAATTALDHEIVLGDANGQQLVNSRMVAEATTPTPLPRMGSIDVVRRVVATHRPAVSGLFSAGSDGHASLAVVVPVLRGDRLLYVLALNLTPASLSRVLADQNLPEHWTAFVVDMNDRVFARNDAPAGYAGAPVPENVRRNAVGDRAVWIGTWPGGVESLAAMQRQHLADWRVVVAVPLAVLEQPLDSTIAFLAITGVVALIMAGLLAWRLADTVARPLRSLAEAADAMGRGRPVQAVSSSISEVDAVSRALVQSGAELQARSDALAAERAQLAAIIDTVPVGLAIAAADGRIITANRNLARMLRAEAVPPGAAGHLDWVIRHPDGRRLPASEGPLQDVLHGAALAELHCICERSDGSTFWTELVAAPVFGADGALCGGVVAVLDIDDVVRARQAEARFAGQLERQVHDRTAALEDANQRLRDEIAARGVAEDQLRQAQKMEAVGQLTGGIAHDFNNLLTIVIGSLDLLRRRAGHGPDGERTRRLLDNALDGAGRAATLTARLLAFSRRQPLSPRALDANQLVLGMADLLHRTLGEPIHVDTVLAGGLWLVHADPNQLESALLNLAVNARDAMLDTPGAGGTLTISTANVVLDDAAAARHLETPPGDYVQLAVSDTGAGMAPEVAARVFEPFFTTKPPGQGTGLGLSQVHGFVMQSGGHVEVRSIPGEGTTVTILLPRTRAAAGAGGPVTQEPVPTAPLMVLVVEDDPAVRRTSVDALHELGHAVLEAADAESALRTLQAHPEVSMLFTDVILPRMDGPALATEARRRHPGLPVLFTSGYPGDQSSRDARLFGWTLLQKPFDVAALAAKLAEASASSRHG